MPKLTLEELRTNGTVRPASILTDDQAETIAAVDFWLESERLPTYTQLLAVCDLLWPVEASSSQPAAG